jgi:hypothetical protein
VVGPSWTRHCGGVSGLEPLLLPLVRCISVVTVLPTVLDHFQRVEVVMVMVVMVVVVVRKDVFWSKEKRRASQASDMSELMDLRGNSRAYE